MRRALILPALLVCVLLAPAAASARPVYGMGDQNAEIRRTACSLPGW